jgi:hypothetical protein
MGAARLDGLHRVALEVDDPIAVGGDQDLAEVQVTVRPDDPRHRRQSVEDGERLGDPGGEVAQQRPGLAARRGDRLVEMPASRRRPSPNLGPGGVPRRQLGDVRARGERDVETGRERTDIGGDLRGELEGSSPGRGPGDSASASGSNRSAPSATNAATATVASPLRQTSST